MSEFPDFITLKQSLIFDVSIKFIRPNQSNEMNIFEIWNFNDNIGFIELPIQIERNSLRHIALNQKTNEVYVFFLGANFKLDSYICILKSPDSNSSHNRNYGGKPSSITLKQLQSISSKHGVKYSGLNKADLVKALKKKRLI
jgi:hypothetical protein